MYCQDLVFPVFQAARQQLQGARAVAGYVASNTVTLVVTTSEVGNTAPRVLRITDAGGATSAATSQLLVTAANNTTYRGIALAPTP